jgi:hypothetical protein
MNASKPNRRRFVQSAAAFCALTCPPACARPSAAYAQVVLAKGPVAYWRLGERSGPTAADAAPAHAHDGTYRGMPQFGVLSAAEIADNFRAAG